MIANIIMLTFHGFLIGIILRDCRKRFGHEVFWLALGFVIVLSTFAFTKYWRFL